MGFLLQARLWAADMGAELTAVGGIPGRHAAVALAQLSANPGFKDFVVRVGSAKFCCMACARLGGSLTEASTHQTSNNHACLHRQDS